MVVSGNVGRNSRKRFVVMGSGLTPLWGMGNARSEACPEAQRADLIAQSGACSEAQRADLIARSEVCSEAQRADPIAQSEASCFDGGTRETKDER